MGKVFNGVWNGFCAVATFDGVCNGFLCSGDNCRIAESDQDTFLTTFVRNDFTNNRKGFSSVQRCFTSTETVRTIRDGDPRTATLIFSQLLSSVPEKRNVFLCDWMKFTLH